MGLAKPRPTLPKLRSTTVLEKKAPTVMAGVNPYITKSAAPPPSRPFHITFLDEESGEKTEVAIDPATFPLGHLGLEGSILDIATEAGVSINHSCGGVCACSRSEERRVGKECA